MPSAAQSGDKVTIPTLEVLHVPHFGYAVMSRPDGGMVLAFQSPAGRRYEFPFDQEERQVLGKAILAPSILTPKNLPPGMVPKG